MTVKELMSASICFVARDAPVSQVAALMKKYNIGMIPVCDSKGCLLGVITDRDIVLRAVASDTPWEGLKSSQIMSSDIVTISPEINIHEAAGIFSKIRFHRLPVVENGRLVGILSISDLAKKRIYLAEVGDIMGSIAKL